MAAAGGNGSRAGVVWVVTKVVTRPRKQQGMSLYLIADPVVNGSLKEELWGYHLWAAPQQGEQWVEVRHQGYFNQYFFKAAWES